MVIINGIDYSKPSQFRDVGNASEPKAMEYVHDPLTVTTPDFSGFKGSYSPSRGTPPAPAPASSGPGPGLSVPQSSPAPVVSYVDVPSGARTLSDAEKWNLQLENAVMMKQLGYGVSFVGDEMVYAQQDYLTQYGQYGYQANYPMYEDYWSQDRGYQHPYSAQRQSYSSPYRGQYQSNSYSGGYGYWPRYGYQTNYYSAYSQRYPYYNQYRDYQNRYEDRNRRWENGYGYNR